MGKRQRGGIRRWLFCLSVPLISTTIVLASVSSKEQILTSMVAGLLNQFHYEKKIMMNDAWSERVFAHSDGKENYFLRCADRL